MRYIIHVFPMRPPMSAGGTHNRGGGGGRRGRESQGKIPIEGTVSTLLCIPVYQSRNAARQLKLISTHLTILKDGPSGPI
jgi:hypothetical protein